MCPRIYQSRKRLWQEPGLTVISSKAPIVTTDAPAGPATPPTPRIYVQFGVKGDDYRVQVVDEQGVVIERTRRRIEQAPADWYALADAMATAHRLSNGRAVVIQSPVQAVRLTAEYCRRSAQGAQIDFIKGNKTPSNQLRAYEVLDPVIRGNPDLGDLNCQIWRMILSLPGVEFEVGW